MTPKEIIDGEARYIVPTYRRPDVVFTHGQGVTLFDDAGKEYLDFASGIAVTSLGHSDPEWVKVVSEGANRLVHVSNLYHTEPHVALAKRLVENSFADKVFFCNSGSEANEAALKFARKYGRASSGNNNKYHLLAFTGGFHGRTIGSLSLTYKAQYKEPFAPVMPGVSFAPFNDLQAAAAAMDEDHCAIIVEPIQGEGGVNPATEEFLQGLRKLADDHDALLIFDEVQCGLGRTGKLWGHQNYGVTPDIMTLAKPLAGGLPIGATLVTDAVAAVMQPGDHGSTFAAGPLVCAAANHVFDRVSQPAFLDRVSENAAYLMHQLRHIESERIKAVRGAGLLVGVEIDQEVAGLIGACRERGLIVINAGTDVLRLAPPLIVEKQHIDQAVSILDECIAMLPQPGIEA